MVRKFDIGRDELVLHLREGKYITGYTTAGAYDEDLGQVKINREILPAYFFDNFAPEKYLYYKKPEEVIENKNYTPPNYNSVENGTDSTIAEETVSKEEYDKLKEEMDEIKKLLEQLINQKG